ncbi:MAG: alpha-galactosidase, partial [Clostridia bacterium]|nr:alpha-galactosidase [Clostridia bacterium]
IGNQCISRDFDIKSGTFLSFTDRVSGQQYPDSTKLQNPVIRLTDADCALSSAIENNLGASEDFLSASITYTSGETILTIRFSIFPGLPFIQTGMTLTTGGGSFAPIVDQPHYASETPFEQSQVLDSVVFGGKHRTMTAYSLYDFSDHRSQPVRSSTFSLYHNGKQDEWGQVFHVTNRLDGAELLLVKNAPVCQSHLHHTVPDLRVEGEHFFLCGAGVDYRELPAGELPLYSSTIGIGKHLLKTHRDLLRAINRGKGTLFTMENTWGDRSGDTKLCDAFIQKEIDAAQQIGFDFVQIDDGWSKGTVDTKSGFLNHVWEGYYTADPEYWSISPKKFPDGFSRVCDYGRKKGVEVGLWFSPDSENEFASWQRDADTLFDFYTRYGIRYFKLDGIHLDTKKAEHRMKAMLDELTRRSKGDMMFQMDVTAGRRFGFLYHRQHGTLFVENRYTDFVNYYPHTTLRNLWLLSKLLPTRQMQFEFLNHRRNPEKYGDDPLAPIHYDMDYLFATVMMSNPLVWMELSELDPRDIPPLKRIVSIWQAHRDALYRADVTPIGEEPSGFAFTGFFADGGDGDSYVLLFREHTEHTDFHFAIPQLAGRSYSIEVLDATGGAEASSTAAGLQATFPRERSYIFLRLIPNL